MRKLAKPPHLIMRIMDCVLLLFQRHLDPVTVDQEKPSTKPSWSEALKLMAAPNFLQGLLSFPKVCCMSVVFFTACFNTDQICVKSAVLPTNNLLIGKACIRHVKMTVPSVYRHFCFYL